MPSKFVRPGEALGDYYQQRKAAEWIFLEFEGDLDVPECAEALEKLGQDREVALESIASFLRHLEGRIGAIREEVRHLGEARDRTENAMAWCREQLLRILDQSGQRTLSAGIHKVTISKSRASEIQDIAAIPAAYKSEFIEVKIDRGQIRKDLLAGKEIPGANLKETKHVRIK